MTAGLPTDFNEIIPGICDQLLTDHKLITRDAHEINPAFPIL